MSLVATRDALWLCLQANALHDHLIQSWVCNLSDIYEHCVMYTYACTCMYKHRFYYVLCVYLAINDAPGQVLCQIITSVTASILYLSQNVDPQMVAIF